MCDSRRDLPAERNCIMQSTQSRIWKQSLQQWHEIADATFYFPLHGSLIIAQVSLIIVAYFPIALLNVVIFAGTQNYYKLAQVYLKSFSPDRHAQRVCSITFATYLCHQKTSSVSFGNEWHKCTKWEPKTRWRKNGIRRLHEEVSEINGVNGANENLKRGGGTTELLYNHKSRVSSVAQIVLAFVVRPYLPAVIPQRFMHSVYHFTTGDSSH